MSSVLRAVVVLAFALAAIALPGSALAAPPPNDDLASATVINPASLPYSDSQTIDDATLESGEQPPTTCYYLGKSAWYSFTAASSGLMAADVGSSSFFDRVLYVYRQDGSGLGGLSTVACASPFYNGQTSATFTVEAGKTYYLEVGSYYSYTTGSLNLSVQSIPPPANDDFASATPIGALSFSDSVDATAATVQAGEPTPGCGYGQSPGTIWYAFTPSVTGSYMATSSAYYFSTQVAVYTGSGVDSLTQIGCRANGQALTFHADAGTTYYLQTGGLFGGRGTINVNFFVAPSPVAGFYFYPGDPSSFDTVQFSDNSYDPGGNSFSSEAWEFGDGGTATNPGCCPTHHYLADGDYKVKLTVTTSDGRTASRTQTIQVRTHDVAVAKMTVPQSASAGQTRSILVGLSNRRYAETVRIDLYRSTAQGFVQFASSTQSVPVRSGNKTSDFAFNYTFTSDDALLGKVNFRAVATIVTGRDALPTDNEMISLPTKVNK